MKTEIASWTTFCNCIESPRFHAGIVLNLDVIIENLATRTRRELAPKAASPVPLIAGHAN